MKRTQDCSKSISDQCIPPMEDAGQSRGMTFLEHLSELRRRIILSLCWLAAFFGFSAFFFNDILNFLKQPLIRALPPGIPSTIYYTGPFDIFSAQIRVAFVAAIVLGCPVWLYHIWKFIEPGLYPREKRYILPFTAASSLLFLGGAAACYYLFAPAMLHFLLTLGISIGTPIITITDYLAMLLTLLLAFGLLCEAPLFLVVLGLLGLVTADQLSRQRKLVVILILILAALVTPSADPISQIMLCIPAYLLFEGSILVILLFAQQNRKID